MKRLRAFITGLLLLLLIFGQVAVAADDIIIDVENGNLKTGSYNIPLAKTDRPISVGMENGNVILVVQTDAGSTIRLNLGQGRVALTTRANPYVRIEQTSNTTGGMTSGSEDQDDGSGNCVICGTSLAVSDHSRFPCGHYVCKVGSNHKGGICSTCHKPLCNNDLDHTPCPQCGKGFCEHDDFLCSYRHNPAPSPFVTTDPAGGTLYFYLSPDGVFMLGNPTGKKPAVWSPAVDNLKGRFPTPTATWNPAKDPWPKATTYWTTDPNGNPIQVTVTRPPNWNNDDGTVKDLDPYYEPVE